MSNYYLKNKSIFTIETGTKLMPDNNRRLFVEFEYKMKTDKIIQELEKNYGYVFLKKGKENMWQYQFLCDLIKDVNSVIEKDMKKE